VRRESSGEIVKPTAKRVEPGTVDMTRLRSLGVAVLSLLAVLAVSGCAATSGVRTSKSIVTFALPPGTYLNYIFPFLSGPTSNNTDLFQGENLLYRPLYWFGNNGKFVINYKQSIGQPPIYSNSGRTVTITLNHYRWSDGQPVTNRDVEFWMNLLFAEKAQWVGYVPGNLPDDIASMSFPVSTPYVFSLTFKTALSHTWALYQELCQIIPIPQHSWDRESSTGPIGSYDRTSAGAVAVYNFMNTQSEDLTTYSTNPLWKVVDGPWHISQYSSATGFAAFTPNSSFSGPGKPRINEFEEIPFTSETAEYDALRSGAIDYGYLPSEDSGQKSYFTSRGYHIENWASWGFNGFFLNFSNPKSGPIFSQLYFRQALQHLVDQNGISKKIYHGSAFPTYGVVPIIPTSPYLTKAQSENPYPYDVKAAEGLLKSHGWSVHPNGVDMCTRPGTGQNQCGSGVGRGSSLNFTMEYATGSAPFSAEMAVMVSDAGLAGVHISAQGEPINQMHASLGPCQSNGQDCTWDIANEGLFGGTATYSPEYLPTASFWVAQGPSDIGGYNNPTINRMLNSLSSTFSVSTFAQYENYVSKELPIQWEPGYYYQTSVIAPKLHGVLPQDPNLNIYPQDWYVS